MSLFNSLYIHVPFCLERKCDYCAFYSETNGDATLKAAYLDRLQQELASQAGNCASLRSIFIGGGTPTALTADELRQLCRIVADNCRLTPDCEWSMEANPESTTIEKLDTALSCGINRFSFGVQSFSETLRQRIGRRGTLQSLPALIAHLQAAGGCRYNLDLIYAIPQETPDEWRKDLETALSYHPSHLSCYSLITEAETPLARRELPFVDDETFIAFWEATDELTQAHGLVRYEISNFASSTATMCRHNFEIWHGQSYIGIGPAAVSFNGIDRWANPSSLTAWLQGAPAEIDHLPPSQRQLEVFAFAFRTTAGWSWPELSMQLAMGRAETCALASIQRLLREGLIEADDQGIRPTRQGLLLNDDILEEILTTAAFDGSPTLAGK